MDKELICTDEYENDFCIVYIIYLYMLGDISSYWDVDLTLNF